ncbi:hypothetical protein [Ottowia caeni]|uniref:hypothetical protein n=1 Tax=Ottowia caeni TaxID=2870339 RepID=UPI001E2BB47D|nr:hypothetical protein [Ottowia caeni]
MDPQAEDDMSVRLYAALFLVVVPGVCSAADRWTCKTIENLLKATDRGLADVASGQARKRPPTAIATYARESINMAERFSTRNPLPKHLVGALSAMAETASSQALMTTAAPELLRHGLVVQAAMPQICPASEVPNLTRHAS